MGQHRALDRMPDRDLGAAAVGHDRHRGERARLALAAQQHVFVPLVDGRHAAVDVAVVQPGARSMALESGEPRVFDRLPRGDDRHRLAAIQEGLFQFGECGRVIRLHPPGGEGGAERGAFHRDDPGTGGAQRCQHLFDIQPERADGSQSGDGDASLHGTARWKAARSMFSAGRRRERSMQPVRANPALIPSACGPAHAASTPGRAHRGRCGNALAKAWRRSPARPANSCWP